MLILMFCLFKMLFVTSRIVIYTEAFHNKQEFHEIANITLL